MILILLSRNFFNVLFYTSLKSRLFYLKSIYISFFTYKYWYKPDITSNGLQINSFYLKFIRFENSQFFINFNNIFSKWFADNFKFFINYILFYGVLITRLSEFFLIGEHSLLGNLILDIDLLIELFLIIFYFKS